MSEYLTLETLEKASEPELREVVVHSLGGKKVKVKSLSANEMSKYFQIIKERNDAGLEQAVAACFIAQAICNEKGEPLFSSVQEALPKLLSMPHGAIVEIAEVAAELTPLNYNQIVARAKKSQEPTQSNS